MIGGKCNTFMLIYVNTFIDTYKWMIMPYNYV